MTAKQKRIMERLLAHCSPTTQRTVTAVLHKRYVIPSTFPEEEESDAEEDNTWEDDSTSDEPTAAYERDDYISMHSSKDVSIYQYIKFLLGIVNQHCQLLSYTLHNDSENHFVVKIQCIVGVSLTA